MGQSTRIGTGQKTVTSSATQIVPANENRISLTLTKLDAPNVFFGCNNAVTTSSGALWGGLCGTSVLYLETTGAIFGITVGASAVVTFCEITQ